MACLDEQQVTQLVERGLAEGEWEAVEQHLDGCEECRRVVSSYAALYLSRSDSVASLATPGSATADPTRPKGALVHRYVVLELLGAGGMGQVYLAYDPQLDRKIALKLVRLRHRASEGSVDARLLQEAQTLARLTHPNVVQVHDVGEWQGEVFFAMELVEQSLPQWLVQKPRSWREVVRVLKEAGQGLAAAHAAGLVHRDFKPANVLVGKDGRARVTDFGLARLADTQAGSVDTQRVQKLLAHVSRSALAGTPAYMSPEQRAGRPVDARSDQYSFCVSLHEALHGYLPGESKAARPAATSPGPAWLQRVIRQGLESEPERRHPSMVALLRRLDFDPVRRWGMGVATATAVLAIAAAGTLFVKQRPSCDGATAKLSSVWNPAEQGVLRAAFEKSTRPYAAATGTAVERELGRYAQQWANLRREACEATQVRGEQSAQVLALRTDCLERRLDDFAALLQSLQKLDDAQLERAVQASAALAPALATCTDTRGLLEKVPADAKTKEALTALEPRLSQLKASVLTGQWAKALPDATKLAEEAKALGYRPFEAEALIVLGRLQERTGDSKGAESTLNDAVAAAQAGADDNALARAAIPLISVLGSGRGDHAMASRWDNFASATVTRAGTPRELAGDLAAAQGLLYTNQRKLEPAFAAFRKAETIRTELRGSDSADMLPVLHGLGTALGAAGKFDEAIVEHRRELDLAERLLGPKHPACADALYSLGAMMSSGGRYSESLDYHRRALELRREALGPLHPRAIDSASALGLTMLSAGQKEQGQAALEEALALHLKSSDADNAVRTANLKLWVGLGLVNGGRGAAAVELLRDAKVAYEKSHGPQTLMVGETLAGLGLAYLREGRPSQALAPLQEAMAIREKLTGPEHFQLSERQTRLGEAYVELGEPKRARELLERALKIREAANRPDPGSISSTRYELARALWPLGERDRARKFMQSAADGFRKSGARDAKELAAAEAWLRTHR